MRGTLIWLLIGGMLWCAFAFSGSIAWNTGKWVVEAFSAAIEYNERNYVEGIGK